jgi:hypothetical protein
LTRPGILNTSIPWMTRTLSKGGKASFARIMVSRISYTQEPGRHPEWPRVV